MANLTEHLGKIRYFFYGVSPADSVEKIEDVPDYLQEGITFYILFGIMEAVYLFVTKQSDKFRANEVITSFSSGVFMKLLMLVFVPMDMYAYVWFYGKFKVFDVAWNSTWAWWLCLVGVDFFYYWFHRMAHEINIMWAAHQVHHSSEDFNFITAIRKSVIQHCTSWMFYLPLALFIPPQIFIAHIQFNLLYQFWLHTEVVGKLGPLEWFLNTPSHHRVHHGRNPYCINKNYGGVFIMWDRMFGTFEVEKEEEEVVYGLVHLVQSFDPIYIQICHLLHMWKRIKNSSGWTETISVLFKGPGWAPGKPRLGCKDDVPSICAPVTKYHPSVSTLHNGFMYLHLLLTVICFLEFDKTLETFSCAAEALFAIYVLFSFTAIGATLDNKSYAPFLHVASNAMFLLGLKYYSSPMTFLKTPKHNELLTSILYFYSLFATVYWGIFGLKNNFLKKHKTN